jgi:hypothetical protein
MNQENNSFENLHLELSRHICVIFFFVSVIFSLSFIIVLEIYLSLSYRMETLQFNLLTNQWKLDENKSNTDLTWILTSTWKFLRHVLTYWLELKFPNNDLDLTLVKKPLTCPTLQCNVMVFFVILFVRLTISHNSFSFEILSEFRKTH